MDVDINKVVELVQQQFPREWTICLQQVIIADQEEQIKNLTPKEEPHE